MKKYRKKTKTQWSIADICAINKICAGRIPEETQVKERKNCNLLVWIDVLPNVADSFLFPRCLADSSWSKLPNSIADSQQPFEKKTFVSIKNYINIVAYLHYLSFSLVAMINFLKLHCYLSGSFFPQQYILL